MAFATRGSKRFAGDHANLTVTERRPDDIKSMFNSLRETFQTELAKTTAKIDLFNGRVTALETKVKNLEKENNRLKKKVEGLESRSKEHNLGNQWH